MSDEQEYATGGYVTPAYRPLLNDGCSFPRVKLLATVSDVKLELRATPYADFDMETYRRLTEEIAKLPPIEPVKLTRQQLEQLPKATTDRVPLGAIPVEIVDDVRESTPYKHWHGKVMADMQAWLTRPFKAHEADAYDAGQ